MHPSHTTLITAFRQGTVVEGGNCASIALIKAAMSRYGEAVFAKHEIQTDTHHVELRDGTKLQFTAAQVRRAAQRADFHVRLGSTPEQTAVNQQILDMAHVYFCAMVVRVMQIGECGDGVGDFEDAIVALNDGADTDQIPDLLGLRYQIDKWASTKRHNGVIAWTRRHAVFAAHDVFDYYGEARNIIAKYPNRLFLE